MTYNSLNHKGHKGKHKEHKVLELFGLSLQMRFKLFGKYTNLSIFIDWFGYFHYNIYNSYP